MKRRKMTNKRKDARVFTQTAKKTKAVNVLPSLGRRGGIRF